QAGGRNCTSDDGINRPRVGEEQERRLIAQQEAPAAPLGAQPATLTSQPASFNNQQRPSVSQPVNFNGQQTPGTISQPTIQPASNTGSRGTAGSPPEKTGEGGGTPESISSSSRPGSPDTLAASLRPENIASVVTKMLALEKAGNAGGFANNPNSLANNANSTVSFNLSPKPIKERVGKTFKVTIEVSGEQQVSGADIALQYDASKLEVKSVRD